MNITAHLKDKPDQDLFKKMKATVFPTLYLLDPQGVRLEVIGPEFGNESAATELLAKHQGLLDARKAVADDPKDKTAQARLALLEATRNPLGADLRKLKKLARTKGLDEETVADFAKFERRFPYLEVEALFSKEMDRLMTKAMKKAQKGDFNLYAQAESMADAKVAPKMYKVFKKIRFKKMIRDMEDPLHWHAWKWSFMGAVRESDKRSAKKILAYLVENFEDSVEHKADVQRMRADYQNM